MEVNACKWCAFGSALGDGYTRTNLKDHKKNTLQLTKDSAKKITRSLLLQLFTSCFDSEGTVPMFPLTCVLDILMYPWYSCTNFL